MMYDLAARITTGEAMPTFGGEPEQKPIKGSVIVVSKEDDPQGMMRLRLRAAGADLKKVHIIGRDRSDKSDDFEVIDRLDTPAALAHLEQVIGEIGDVRMLFIDPASDFAGDLNIYREEHVRKLLSPLADLARTYDLSVIISLHLNKDIKRKPRQRMLGSVALANVARSVLMVGHSSVAGRRLLMMEKCNLVRDRRAVAFAIEEDEEQQPIVEWEMEWEDVDVDAVLSEKAAHVTKQQQAGFKLRAFLADGPRSARDARELTRKLGYHFNTMKAAKKECGIISEKREDGWWWSLPIQEDNVIDFESTPKRRERLDAE